MTMLRNLPCLLALAAAFSCQDPETDPVTPVPPEPEGPSATVYVTDVSGKLMEEPQGAPYSIIHNFWLCLS